RAVVRVLSEDGADGVLVRVDACGGEVVDDVLGVRVREGVRGGADSGPDGSGVPLVRAAVRVRGGELVSGLDGVEEVEADTDRAAQRLPGAGRIHDPAEERDVGEAFGDEAAGCALLVADVAAVEFEEQLDAGGEGGEAEAGGEAADGVAVGEVEDAGHGDEGEEGEAGEACGGAALDGAAGVGGADEACGVEHDRQGPGQPRLHAPVHELAGEGPCGRREEHAEDEGPGEADGLGESAAGGPGGGLHGGVSVVGREAQRWEALTWSAAICRFSVTNWWCWSGVHSVRSQVTASRITSAASCTASRAASMPGSRGQWRVRQRAMSPTV